MKPMATRKSAIEPAKDWQDGWDRKPSIVEFMAAIVSFAAMLISAILLLGA